jgi:cytidylate kinase
MLSAAMPVITITGLTGAGREPIGAIVAERLDAELVDRKLYDEVSRRLDLPSDEVERQEECPSSLLDRVLQALGTASVEFAAPPEATAWNPPYGEVAFDTRKAVLQVTQEVIREAARSGNAVIVGRGGPYVLNDVPGIMHVFVHGDQAERARMVQRVHGLDEAEAMSRVKSTDANRTAYVKQVYNHDWLRATHYHLVLNSCHFGWERTADMVVRAAT